MIPGYESGQLEGLGDLLGEVVSGGAIGGALRDQAVATLQDPDVQRELRRAARPMMIEGALYVAGAVALTLLLLR